MLTGLCRRRGRGEGKEYNVRNELALSCSLRQVLILQFLEVICQVSTAATVSPPSGSAKESRGWGQGGKMGSERVTRNHGSHMESEGSLDQQGSIRVSECQRGRQRSRGQVGWALVDD